MNTFTNQRTMPARPEAVFAALTTPERLARWWGPAGFSNRFAVCEVQPGGRWVFDDAAFAQAAAHILVPANEQNLDRLQAELQP